MKGKVSPIKKESEHEISLPEETINEIRTFCDKVTAGEKIKKDFYDDFYSGLEKFVNDTETKQQDYKCPAN